MGARWGLFLVVAVMSAASFAACGNGTGSTFPGSGQDGGGSDGMSGPDGLTLNRDGGGGDAVSGTLTIKPADATIKVTELTKLPTEGYTATLTSTDGKTKTVTPVWSLADYTIGGDRKSVV